MCWYPDDENGDIDGGDESDGAPFQSSDRAAMFGDESDSVDDDLHQQLDLEYPKEENKEKNW